MCEIRSFRREDIPAVTALWLKVFRGSSGPATASLEDYFREIFFDAPGCDPQLPSLVYEEEGRGIAGFMGVIPRTMSFQGRTIKVAVATQLMMDKDARAPYAAIKLMRRYFAGAQDLSFSDGANEDAERLWLAAGGEVALPDSLAWVRVLRPAQYAASILNRRQFLRPVALMLKPLCVLADAALVRSSAGRRFWLPDPATAQVEEQPSVATLLWCIRTFSGKRALRPDYDHEQLRWLLDKAAEKKIHGDLRKGVVRDAGGRIIGWYLYYLNKGDIAQVLQFGGIAKSIRIVMQHLFRQAWGEGAVAITGKLEPGLARELVGSRCWFTWPGYGTLAQSKNREILAAIHGGDAFLSRLEGEWWARFADPAWSMRAPPQDNAGAAIEGMRSTAAAKAG